MFTWVVVNIPGIQFFFLTTTDMQENTTSFNLEARFSSCKTVPGTRSHHAFIPRGNLIEMRRLSVDTVCTAVVLTDYINIDNDMGTTSFEPGKYAACMYDKNWFLGNIIEQNDDEHDLLLTFMKCAESSFSWPSNEDKCGVPMMDMLCAVGAPIMQGQSGRQYKLDQDDFYKIVGLAQDFCTK